MATCVDLPKHLVFDIGEVYTNFNAVVSDISLPMVDVDAVFDQVFVALCDVESAPAELALLAANMARSDNLFENHDIDSEVLDGIEQAVFDLGIYFYTHLSHIKAYTGGFFPYKYKGLRHERTLILERVDSP